MRRELKRSLVIGVAAALLAGCATDVPRRDAGVVMGHAGASDALVFEAARVAAVPEDLRPEYGRRDASLSYRRERAIRSIDSWPVAPRPTIERRRIIHLPRSSGTFLYFEPGY